MFRIILSLTVLAAIAAFFTRPDPQQVQSLLRAKVQEQIARQDTNASRPSAENAALAICKVSASACAELIVSATKVTYTDRWLFAQVDLAGFGKSATCYGIFARLSCWGDIPSS